MDILPEDPQIVPSRSAQDPRSYSTQLISGSPKSGKTKDLLARAIQAAKQGAKTLLVSQNPSEAAALQERAWLLQQQAPERTSLEVVYSHSLIEELIKKLFPKMGYFSLPTLSLKDTQSLVGDTAQFHEPTISLSKAIDQLANPKALSPKDYQQAGYQYQAIFVDDATLQPGYLTTILRKMLLPGGRLVEVHLRTNPYQLYHLNSQHPSTENRHSLSIRPAPRATKQPDTLLIGRWAISCLKKIILDQYEFSYASQQKNNSIDIALAFPLGDKDQAPLDLNHPWTEAKRWRRYLAEHKEKLEPNPSSAHTFQIELPAPGLSPSAGSCILVNHQRRKKPPTPPTVRIFCQPYFALYGQYFDWLILPYLDTAYLPKTPHRQLQYLWFLASRAKSTLAIYHNRRSFPNWLLNQRHPQRLILEKSIALDLKT